MYIFSLLYCILFLFTNFYYGSACYKVAYVRLDAVCIILSQQLASAILVCVENMNSVPERIIPANSYDVKLLTNMQEVSGATPSFSQLRSEGRIIRYSNFLLVPDCRI